MSVTTEDLTKLRAHLAKCEQNLKGYIRRLGESHWMVREEREYIRALRHKIDGIVRRQSGI